MQDVLLNQGMDAEMPSPDLFDDINLIEAVAIDPRYGGSFFEGKAFLYCLYLIFLKRNP
jgi:hypothetical protein